MHTMSRSDPLVLDARALPSFSVPEPFTDLHAHGALPPVFCFLGRPGACFRDRMILHHLKRLVSCFEDKEHCKHKKPETDEIIHAESFVFENHYGEEREHDERYYFLNNLQLP
jgi:hypothetical protein